MLVFSLATIIEIMSGSSVEIMIIVRIANHILDNNVWIPKPNIIFRCHPRGRRVFWKFPSYIREKICHGTSPNGVKSIVS